ncbi:deoxyhypusine hydroxylase isoform X2 [Rhinoderma darwinii]|uniref:deoxyhypusine hydroxylase isoform X2 n=1 Tax=Rhinoderma darwinii TaxID=43563 RepID=UPI003F677157
MAAPGSNLVASVGRMLLDTSLPLPARFRALFTLRNLGGPEAVGWIGRGFVDESALLKHELAYCLGQMRDRCALPVLSAVLRDRSQEPMVRHEAGEALGAIGDPEVLELLKEYSQDSVIEVAETCQLAIHRIEWLQRNPDTQDDNPFLSVDPAPPAEDRDIAALRGLQCGGSLFRHEIGYVLGQMQHEAAVPGLAAALDRLEESPMVRHECAEALGSIAQEDCLIALKTHVGDLEQVVRESCEVALDMYKYENSGDFQYANGLSQIQELAS